MRFMRHKLIEPEDSVNSWSLTDLAWQAVQVSRLSENFLQIREDFFNAEAAEVGAERRGGEFSLRPLRKPLRPLR
jgi:hypothetical protein